MWIFESYFDAASSHLHRFHSILSTTTFVLMLQLM